MATTSFAFGESYGVHDHYTFDDREVDERYIPEEDDQLRENVSWLSYS
jgi:hypothetical protein